jgi:ferritin-like metal-binding protein YciE
MARTPDAKLIEALREAHSQELALVSNLEAHIGIAGPGDYRSRLEVHLKETRQHEDRIRQRLDELGFTRNLLQFGLGLVRTVIGQTFVLAKGPIDVVRGGLDVNEKMVRNARDGIVTESLEIATYDYIERLARNLGDETTAELAAEIRRDEEAMLQDLRGFIDELTDRVVRSQITTTPASAVEPWVGYDEQTVEQITKELAGSPEGLRLRVRQYERRNKNRSTVIEATERNAT